MAFTPTVPTVRTEAADLRVRSGALRERSREIRQRSQLWREWSPRAAEDRSLRSALADLDAARETSRLRRAEVDLQRAIAECESALAEVRRELHGQDVGTTTVVH